jgi:hypothetical protein
MEFIGGNSTNIHSFGYDADLAILAIRFHRPGNQEPNTYIYVGVDIDTAKGLSLARSKGAFFSSKIRGQFPYFEKSKIADLVGLIRPRESETNLGSEVHT